MYKRQVSSVAVYGGNDGILFEQQKKGLTLGADVVIATPGRLIAHLSLAYVDLVFTGDMPDNVRVGKSFRVQIELGQPEQAPVSYTHLPSH